MIIESHLGEIYALIVAVFWTITALSFEKAVITVGSLSVNFIRLIMALAMLSIFNFLFKDSWYPQNASLHNWLWLLLSGFVGLIFGDIFLLKSFQIIGSRLSMLIMTLAPPIAAVLGWLFIHENISKLAILGIILTLTGIIITILPRIKNEKLHFSWKGILFAFFGAIGQATGIIFSKIGMEGNYDAFAATQIRLIAGTIGFTIIVFIFNRSNNIFIAIKNKRAMKNIFFGSFFGPFLGISFSLLSLHYTSSGIASTIMATVPILIILPSVFIYKQKIGLYETIGTFLSVGGVALFFI